jgi:hypothetical protein
MSDKFSQLYERALRNLKNSSSRAWAGRNESQIRVPEKLLAAARPTPADAPVIRQLEVRDSLNSYSSFILA